MNNIRSIVTLPVTIAIMLGAIFTITTGFSSTPSADKVLAYESSQAGSLANTCGNADEAFNVLCQNLFSQIEGDGNAVNIIGLQTGGERTTTPSEPPTTGTAKLIVIKDVRCTVPVPALCPLSSAFEMRVTVNDVLADSFAGEPAPGKAVDIEPGSYSVDETLPKLPAGQSVTTTKSPECSGTIRAGETVTCTIINSISVELVTICHIPPGNPENAHTIFVSPNAVAAHLAHGDTLGPCEQN